MSSSPLRTTRPSRAQSDPSRWVRDHADALYRFALLRVRSENVAEDLVQETFLGALRCIAQFDQRASERTWLTSILRRKIADYFRSRGIVEQTPNQADLRNASVRQPACQPWSADPSRLAEDAEFWQVFRGCASKLSPALADVYSLQEFCELSIDSIAELLGITPANVSLRLFRARADLRDCLERKWFRHRE